MDRNDDRGGRRRRRPRQQQQNRGGRGRRRRRRDDDEDEDGEEEEEVLQRAGADADDSSRSDDGTSSSDVDDGEERDRSGDDDDEEDDDDDESSGGSDDDGEQQRNRDNDAAAAAAAGQRQPDNNPGGGNNDNNDDGAAGEGNDNANNNANNIWNDVVVDEVDEIHNDDDEDDDDEEDEDDNEGNGNGDRGIVIEGYIAEQEPPSRPPPERGGGLHDDEEEEDDGEGGGGRPQPSSHADITLYLTCREAVVEGHPVLDGGPGSSSGRRRRGARPKAVKIGFGKNTKLGAVLKRYVDVCNHFENYLTARQRLRMLRREKGAAAKFEPIELSDLEFVHVEVLGANKNHSLGSETAESAALMKNDTLLVRKERSQARKDESDMKKLQQQLDRDFFEQLRSGLLERPQEAEHVARLRSRLQEAKAAKEMEESKRNDDGKKNGVGDIDVKGDVILLQCAQEPAQQQEEQEEIHQLQDEEDNDVSDYSNNNMDIDQVGETEDDKKQGKRQRKLKKSAGAGGDEQQHTSIAEKKRHPKKANALICYRSIVYLRCPWLRRRIEEAERAAVDGGVASTGGNDDPAGAVVVPRAAAAGRSGAPRGSTSAAEIVDDDEDEGAQSDAAAMSETSGVSPTAVDFDIPGLLKVRVDHPREAVELLLEYLYTNRVVPFGVEAFVLSCRTKPAGHHNSKKIHPSKHHHGGGVGDGPVPPFPTSGSSATRRWPNKGEPTVSFRAALASVSLAQEAGLSRLVLMSEIAASRLVGPGNFTDALQFCFSHQQQYPDTNLSYLRKAAMDIVLRSGPRGVLVLPSFRRALQESESGSALVPTLLTGTMEAVAAEEERKNLSKRSRKGSSHHHGRSHRHRDSSRHKTPDHTDEWRDTAFKYFRVVDRQDNIRRDEERRKKRLKRDERTVKFDPEILLAEQRTKRMKRMSNHLDHGSSRLSASIQQESGVDTRRRKHK